MELSVWSFDPLAFLLFCLSVFLFLKWPAMNCLWVYNADFFVGSTHLVAPYIKKPRQNSIKVVYHQGLGLATCLSFLGLVILAHGQVYFECFNNVNNALSDAHTALASDLAKV